MMPKSITCMQLTKLSKRPRSLNPALKPNDLDNSIFHLTKCNVYITFSNA
jgi:hypothetical protein